MSTPTEPGDLLARNEVTRPVFATLATGSPADGWLQGGTGTFAPRVGGTDRRGSPVPTGALHTETTLPYALHTLLPGRISGEDLQVLVDYRTDSTAAGVSVELVTDRASALQTAGPSCVMLPASTTRTVAAAALVVPAAGDVWLRLTARAGGTLSRLYLFGVRVDTRSDELGIFTGDTEDTEDVAYTWQDEPYASPSIAHAAGTPTPPAPPPGLGDKVAQLLGADHDPRFVARAHQAAQLVTAMAHQYTRGRGFTPTPSEGIEAVITTAAMRLLANPEQTDHGLGGQWTRGGFSGWTLAEQYVLNGYRKRASG